MVYFSLVLDFQTFLTLELLYPAILQAPVPAPSPEYHEQIIILPGVNGARHNMINITNSKRDLSSFFTYILCQYMGVKIKM